MILPGKTIGILGGGQLGRMFAIAARRMGYRVAAFDPTQDCPTGQIADIEVNAAYDDIDAARLFAEQVDVVTFEFENVPSETLAAIERIRPVFPSPFVLETTRHRLREKNFLASNNFPVAEFVEVKSVDDLRLAVEKVGTPCVLKTASFGYDGKGQVKIDASTNVNDAWGTLVRAFGSGAEAPGLVGVVEQFVHFAREVSVIVARTRNDEVRCFEVFENQHRNHILDITTVNKPGASAPDRIARSAKELATQIARAIDLVGLLCVEMFVTQDNSLIVNELAPRPHNSGHVTFDAAVTSQFEQQLRAVCGLPLGDPSIIQPAAMANLLGDLWQHGEPNWPVALRDPRIKLHLYGKKDAKPGRKMGHLTALAESVAEARQAVIAAREALLIR
jgi:5-(carboxyamino)imidazole ribonucleotide synthase